MLHKIIKGVLLGNYILANGLLDIKKDDAAKS